MSDELNSEETTSTAVATTEPKPAEPPKPLNSRQRRLLGVLIEKARTTPDAYPLTVTGLVTGANQKSNRHPIMNLTPEQIEDELITMRHAGIIAEVQGGGRVPRYRHYGYDYLGVKGVEAGVMTELLLRGEQSAGDLRTRASRFEVIPDLPAMQTILRSLIEKKLVVELTPPGRGQIYSHNLYQPEELEKLRAKFSGHTGEVDDDSDNSAGPARRSSTSAELTQLREEVSQLRETVSNLQERIAALESRA